MANRIKELRQQAGLSQDALGALANTSGQQIARLETGARRLSTDWMDRLAPHLGVRSSDLVDDGGSDQATSKPPAPDPMPQPNARFIPMSEAPDLPVLSQMPRDVPVYGSAQGGEDGAFELNYLGEIVDWVRRPPGLIGATKVFAIYVEGDSMSPWREPGQPVYVHSVQPARPGDYVVVVVPQKELGRPPMAYLKRLVRRSSDGVVVSQYNPPKELTFPSHQGVKVLRVIDWDEALGMR